MASELAVACRIAVMVHHGIDVCLLVRLLVLLLVLLLQL